MRKASPEKQLEFAFTTDEIQQSEAVETEQLPPTERKVKHNPRISELAAVAGETIRALDQQPEVPTIETIESELIETNVSEESEVATKETTPHINYHLMLTQELQKDLDDFSPKQRRIIEQFITNKKAPGAIGVLDQWWLKKFGFSYGSVKARKAQLLKMYLPDVLAQNSELQEALDSVLQERTRKTLKQKLAPKKTVKKVDTKSEEASAETEVDPVLDQRLQEFLQPIFDLIASPAGRDWDELRQDYERANPESLEYINSLFAVIGLLKHSKIGGKNKKKIFSYSAEGRYLINHLVIVNRKNPEFLREFWRAAELLSSALGDNKKYHILETVVRSSTLSTAASYELLEILGYRPQLSYPDEDIYRAIDLWLSNKGAVQIKSSQKRSTPDLVKSDELSFPLIEAEGVNQNLVVSGVSSLTISRQKLDFFAKVKEYGEAIGKELTGYYLVIPMELVDRTTGEPKPELVDFFRTRLADELKKNQPAVKTEMEQAPTDPNITRRSFWRKFFGF